MPKSRNQALGDLNMAIGDFWNALADMFSEIARRSYYRSAQHYHNDAVDISLEIAGMTGQLDGVFFNDLTDTDGKAWDDVGDLRASLACEPKWVFGDPLPPIGTADTDHPGFHRPALGFDPPTDGSMHSFPVVDPDDDEPHGEDSR